MFILRWLKNNSKKNRNMKYSGVIINISRRYIIIDTP